MSLSIYLIMVNVVSWKIVNLDLDIDPTLIPTG
jgi:hypothetical protein